MNGPLPLLAEAPDWLIAHAGHWLVSVSYFIPIVGFLVWLVVVQVRDRRRSGKEDEEE